MRLGPDALAAAAATGGDPPRRRFGGRRALTLTAAALSANLLELVVPIAILQVYDRIVPNRSEETLGILLLCAAGLLALGFLVLRARGALNAHISAAEAHRLAYVAAARALAADARLTARRGAGENLALLAAARAMKDQELQRGPAAVADMALAPIAIGVIALIAGPLALAPCALALVFVLFNLRGGAALGRRMRAQADLDAARHDFIIETLRSAVTLKTLSLETIWLRRYEKLKLSSCRANRRVSRELTRLFDRAASFSTMMTFSVVLIGAVLVARGELNAGALIASVLLAGRVAQPAQRALSLLVRRRDAGVARATARGLLDLPPMLAPAAEQARRAPGGAEGDAPRNDGRLELRGVRYCGLDGEILLQDADLTLAPGDCVTLDADPPEARSEILKLMAGLRMPEAGETLLNGVPLRRFDPQLRAVQAGYLAPVPTLYRGAALDNITRFGQTDLADALYVARLLRLDADLAAMPGGLETPLQGDESDELPHGLVQRLALARALAPRPRLILFDEADAGLDRDAYAALHDLFAQLRGRATLVLATADRNLRDFASRRIVVENGRLTAAPRAARDRLDLAPYRELRL